MVDYLLRKVDFTRDVLNEHSQMIVESSEDAGHDRCSYVRTLAGEEFLSILVEEKEVGCLSEEFLSSTIQQREKRLVEVTQQFPKKVVALPFEVYLHNCIEAKQKEIDELRESRRQLREVLCKLQPVALKLNDKVQVFEPSCRRGLNSSPAS